MANKPIKDQIEPMEPTVVGEAIKAALPEINKIVENKPELTQKIYVGPNLLELPTYTVVEDEFTTHLKELIEKCPSIEKFFVPIDQMAQVESRAKIKGTLEHRHYNKVIAYRNGEVE